MNNVEPVVLIFVQIDMPTHFVALALQWVYAVLNVYFLDLAPAFCNGWPETAEYTEVREI